MPDSSWAMCGPPTVLVNESSAKHGRPGEDKAHHVQAINRSHSDMVKFGRGDTDYDVVVGYLEDFTECAIEVVKNRFQQADGEGATLRNTSVCKFAS
jgi:hypothetical protein